MRQSVAFQLVSSALILASVSARELPAQALQKAILVTGASTGIGRKMTELLASRGFFVFATARKEKDLAELDEIKNVQAVKMDVTSKEGHRRDGRDHRKGRARTLRRHQQRGGHGRRAADRVRRRGPRP